MDTGQRSAGLSAAERALVGFLQSNPAGTETDLEAYLDAHPGQASEMRRLYQSWMAVESLAGELSAASGWLPRILQRFGEVDPRIDLSDSARAPDASHAALLSQLAATRRPAPRYTLREQIARGGMGTIFKVWDSDLRRHLAMKVLHGRETAPTPADRDALTRFLEEAQVTGQLDHPSVVPVHDIGVDSEGRVFFTMRLVRGRDLKRILPLIEAGEEGWTLTRALNVLLRACEAVAYAHAKGVIHRDLKPANMMVGRFGEVYVMDWGLARVMTRADRRDLRVKLGDADAISALLSSRIETDRAQARDSAPDVALVTLDGTVVGTPCYMPPEQALGELDALGPRSDVYSLGAILYQLLTGTMPYVPKGKNVRAQLVLVALIDGPPKPVRELRPDAPEELVAICAKAMAREPADRYASAIELADDIRAFLEHRPVTARRHSLREVARLAYERNRPVVVTAAIAGALLLLALSVFVWRLQRSLTETRAESAQRARISSSLASRALLQQADELALTTAGAGEIGTWTERVTELLERVEDLRAELRDQPAGSDRGREVGATLDNLDRLRPLLRRARDWHTVAASLATRLVKEDAQAWKEACAAVARSSLYGGRQLKPQVGLVPLRENPLTHLWEFWHVASGARPEVDTVEDDRYRLDPETGIVLVLLPGGKYTAGDLPIQADEEERRAVTFDVPMIFIGKYEVTQGQWTRVIGHNDACWTAGVLMPSVIAIGVEPAPFTELHPIEMVDWFDAGRFARRLGMVLPYEVIWEYACRGGTRKPWCWGEFVADLEDNENLRDQSSRNVIGDLGGYVPWNDGYPVTAPVGSFEPNEFGLFDVHGNVAEWCGDQQDKDYWLAKSRVRTYYRGGSWNHPALNATATFRYDREPKEAFSYVGLRVARVMDP